MTNKEFAFNYAGKEFMFYGDRVIVVGYDNECPDVVIVSPASGNARGCFWAGLDNTDVITYRDKRETYQYSQIGELEPITEEKPQTVTEEKPKTPGECCSMRCVRSPWASVFAMRRISARPLSVIVLS